MSLLNEIFNKITNPSNYIIDIGASSGVNTDPIYEFIINSKYNGLCIEGNKNNIHYLKQKTKFNICDEYIYPHNILSIFKKFNVPINIDILKVDIDGFDLEVIRTILTKYKPKIIIAEYNEKIPPPILFETKFKIDYVWDYSHCFGFSIKSGEVVMNKYDYKIINIYDLNNILCVNEELYKILNLDLNSDLKLDLELNTVEKLYKAQYIKNPLRIKQLPWNENVNYWLKIKNIDELKSEIINYFCTNNNRSKFLIKNKIINVDFTIE